MAGEPRGWVLLCNETFIKFRPFASCQKKEVMSAQPETTFLPTGLACK